MKAITGRGHLDLVLWRGMSQCTSKSIASVGHHITRNIANVIGSITNVSAALLAERTAIGRVR